MKDLVHYLVAHPTEAGKLCYPSEIDRPNYTGFGAFYLVGKHKDSAGDSYRMHAIHETQIIEVKLLPYRNTKSFLVAEIPSIGKFVFNVQPIPRKKPYELTHPSLEGLTPIRRLRSWRPFELDRACSEHNFYFVGYSPTIATAG